MTTFSTLLYGEFLFKKCRYGLEYKMQFQAVNFYDERI